MFKFFIYLFSICLIFGNVHAQTHIRKIPFLPYTGITTAQPNEEVYLKQNRPKRRNYETVYFYPKSIQIRKDQKERIIQIGKRLEKEGSNFFTILAITTPEISTELAQARARRIADLLSEFQIGTPVYNLEHRKKPFKNPNRVEIYMGNKGTSLGSTIR